MASRWITDSCAVVRIMLGYEMITLGVWIFAAALWHSPRVSVGISWTVLIAAILVSVFVK